MDFISCMGQRLAHSLPTDSLIPGCEIYKGSWPATIVGGGELQKLLLEAVREYIRPEGRIY